MVLCENKSMSAFEYESMRAYHYDKYIRVYITLVEHQIEKVQNTNQCNEPTIYALYIK